MCLQAGFAHPTLQLFLLGIDCWVRFLKIISDKCSLGSWASANFSGELNHSEAAQGLTHS